MRDIASYKAATSLETDKKVNLVYGLNGTGKSVLSNYLYDPTNQEFADCSIEGLTTERLYVYNQKFVQDYFFESEGLDGIFTLSKENKIAEGKLEEAKKEQLGFDLARENQVQRAAELGSELNVKKQALQNKIWEIKKTYSGGDRVLEFCLDGLRGNKSVLFGHLSSIDKPEEEPKKSINELKKEVESLEGDRAQPCNLLEEIAIDVKEMELDEHFKKTIVGNENSSIAGLIKTLENSDWVRQGLAYLPDEIETQNEQCPFCQESTISSSVLENIRGYFDVTYDLDVQKLRKSLTRYEFELNKIPHFEVYENNVHVKANGEVFRTRYDDLCKILSENKKLIEEKIVTPGKAVTLEASSDAVSNLNLLIDEINVAIAAHNLRIENKKDSLIAIKELFWSRMRWDYEHLISSFSTERRDLESKIVASNHAIKGIDQKIDQNQKQMREYQHGTVNIEEAIDAINGGLQDLGIDDFRIEKHTGNLYKVTREDDQPDAFQTLSEGEKMIISFLYFVERCKGKTSAADVTDKKVIVIDDPISSLSHIFIFNIGELIKNEFLRSNRYEQVIVLTHSLYFFYEITDIDHKRRKRDQKLFRLIKNTTGSQIKEMKYEEIQSDYQAYWQVIKDENQPPALIANCMRNIVEYFFNFIEKRDLNNLFEQCDLQDNKYQAFRRYINRESHSLGQNIFDFKEFDYGVFYEALEQLFEKCGYKEHYEKMMK